MGLASDHDVIELVRRARAAIHSTRYEIEVVRELTALIDAYDSATAGGGEQVGTAQAVPSPAMGFVAEPAQPPAEAVLRELADRMRRTAVAADRELRKWGCLPGIAPGVVDDWADEIDAAFGGKAGA